MHFNLRLNEDRKRDWAVLVNHNIAAFLQNHADCERKACYMALAILGKYPERKAIAPVLIKVAQDKLNRFRMVYNLLDGRALRLGIELPDDMYTKQLSWLKKGGKEDRFIYQLLTAAVIHERECMMLELFQQVVSDKDLADKYQIFLGSVNPYTGMLGHYLSEVVLRDKMAEMSLAEAKIYEGIALAPALH